MPVVQFPQPITSAPGIFVKPAALDVMNPLTLSLAAAKFPGKPAQAAGGYPITNTVFIDWNKSDKSWWFKWNQKMNTASKMVWQVSSMPYTGSAAEMEKPMGLVANGVIGVGEKEFKVDFSKFVLSHTAVKQNLITPAFLNTLGAAVSAQNSSGQSTTGQGSTSAAIQASFSAFKNSLAKQTSKSSSKQTGRINVIKEAAKQIAPAAQKGAGAATTLVPAASQEALKSVLATMGITSTQYKYYVRVIAVDKDGKPIGSPSNPIEVIYGSPSFYDETTGEEKPVRVYQKEFGYDDKCFIDWTNTYAFQKIFAAPISEQQNYVYSYFQVTTQSPFAGKRTALSPPGLVASGFSETVLKIPELSTYVEAAIDFSKFAPPADKNNPVQYRYYVRAVHVYADYDNPGMARLKFSPPLTVTYGANDAKAIQEAATVSIDIGTPSVRFVEYEPPFPGANPEDTVEVVKTPGEPFDKMQPGQKYSLKLIQYWLEDQANDKNAFEVLLDCFTGLYKSMASLVNKISDLWAKLQQSVVGLLGAIGIPESVGGFMVSAALAACGIPPSIPDISNLKNLGSSYITTMIVEQTGGIIPKEIAEKVVNELMDQAEAAANTVVSDLPDELSALNGCVKPDVESIWHPATIRIEMYNPYKTQIPSGEFDLTIGEAGGSGIDPATNPYFRPQRLQYPAIPAGETVSMAFPLEENIGWYIEHGMKHFLTAGQYNQWEVMLSHHKKLGAYITDITPHIPDYDEFAKELGLSPGTFMVSFNYQNYQLGAVQDMNDIYSEWHTVGTSGEHFPGVIYVSPSGNDNWAGSKEKPLKSITTALIKADKGDAVVLLPGTYQTDGLELYKPYVRLYGSGAGTVLKGSAKCAAVLTIKEAATGALASGMTIEGGTQQGVLVYGKSKAGLENLKVQNSGGNGIKVTGGNKMIGLLSEGASIVNCQVINTGLKTPAQGYGILVQNAVGTRIQGCTITNTPADGVRFAKDSAGSTASYCTVSQCGGNGVFLEGEDVKAANSFIHDTDAAGVMFSGTKNCNVSNCTLLDTAKKSYTKFYAPITLGISQYGPNSADTQQVQNMGVYALNYADHNIIVQQNTPNRQMVVIQYDGKSTALGYGYFQQPWIENNIYYAKEGAVQFYDGRPYGLTGLGNKDKDPAGPTYQGGLSSEWMSMASAMVYNGYVDYSFELDPKINAKGRSTLPDYAWYGVQ
jgi:hypothetical protein